MKFFWWIVWSFISPTAMIVILLGSIIFEIVRPLMYTVYGYVETEVSKESRAERERERE